MSKNLNTARALLQAKNFEAARRIIKEILENHPDDIDSWELYIKLEMEAKNFKKSLELCHQTLKRFPDNAILRKAEFDALIPLKKKKEAKQAFEKFKQDFPNFFHQIESMRISLDAIQGNVRNLKKTLDEFGNDSENPSMNRNLGIARHKICDLFYAQELMEKAHPHFLNDAQLNAFLAMNSYQLVRPATARKYARLALKADPRNVQMRLVSWLSYGLYLPNVFLFAKLCMVFLCLIPLVSKVFCLVIFISFILLANDFLYFPSKLVATLSGIDELPASFASLIVMLVVVIGPRSQFIIKLLQPKKEVKLRKY